MNFFYLDETGDTGVDLENAEQPIFVLGGVTVSDKGWRKTTDAVQNVVNDFFNGAVPNGFELHAHELVAHEGPFAKRNQADCNALALSLLDLVGDLKHRTRFIGIDKKLLLEHANGEEHDIIDCRTPYLLAFNYLVSYLERFVREQCGKSARGMIIIDQKDMYLRQVDELTHYRRFAVPKARQLKRVVEFSHSIDSLRHPLIQLSDLVIYTTRKFLECDNRYRPNWSAEAKNFFASCYDRVQKRMWRTNLIEIMGEGSRNPKSCCNCANRPTTVSGNGIISLSNGPKGMRLVRSCSMKMRVAEVTYQDRIEEYDVIAKDNVQARDLVVKHLAGTNPKWTSIRVRDTPNEMTGPARVIGKRPPASAAQPKPH
jgi:Protein of unknown function (DUF3800)